MFRGLQSLTAVGIPMGALAFSGEATPTLFTTLQQKAVAFMFEGACGCVTSAWLTCARTCPAVAVADSLSFCRSHTLYASIHAPV